VIVRFYSPDLSYYVLALPQSVKERIITPIGRLVLLSDKVVIDVRHAPKLYARSFEGLLDHHVADQRSAASSMQSPERTSEVAAYAATVKDPWDD
jgi:hypothetical protein